MNEKLKAAIERNREVLEKSNLDNLAHAYMKLDRAEADLKERLVQVAALREELSRYADDMPNYDKVADLSALYRKCGEV